MSADAKPRQGESRSERILALKAEMETALSLMSAYAANWLEVFNVEPAAADRYDELHANALRDFRRAERKLRKLEKR